MAMRSVIEIRRPVEPVFGFFLDLEQSIVRTDPMVESVVKTTEGPLGAGTTFLIRQPVMGRVREQTMRVTAVDPNRRIDMEAAFGPVRPRFSLTFEPIAGGTRVTLRGSSRPIGPLKLVPFLPSVIAAAEKAGALGAFLSGSGSTIAAVTLHAPKKVAAAMARAANAPGCTIVTHADNLGAQLFPTCNPQSAIRC